VVVMAIAIGGMVMVMAVAENLGVR
jgi:hypothetical protein